MSTLTGLIGGGGDAIPPIDGTMMLNNFDSLVTLGGGTFLKSGVIEDDPSVYPDAYVTSGPYNLNGMILGNNLSIGAQETFPTALAFNNDGTKMYVIGTTGDRVYEYTLSTAFSVSTASYFRNFSVSAQETNPQGLAFNNDGTKMYVVGNAIDAVFEYILSTAFVVSTAAYSGNSFSVSAQETNTQGLAFNNDGTKMYVVGVSNRAIYEYTLSTAFSVSTASYSGNSFSVSAQDLGPAGLAFNNDGTKMYVIGTTGDRVYEYTLSTAFSVSTASYSENSFRVAAQETVPNALAFNNDGTKMYVIGATTDAVYEYSIPAAEWVGSPISYSEGTVNQYVRVA